MFDKLQSELQKIERGVQVPIQIPLDDKKLVTKAAAVLRLAELMRRLGHGLVEKSLSRVPAP